MHKLDKGSLSESKILAALLAAEYKVSIPWGQNTRYDLIADKDGILYRIQCKTAWLSKDGWRVRVNYDSSQLAIIKKPKYVMRLTMNSERSSVVRIGLL